MKTALKVGLIGLGNMGRNHARVLSDLPGANLVGVADPSPERRAEYRPVQGVSVYDDYRKMLDEQKPEAVVLTVPTALHCEIGCDVLSRNIHLLVEKPIAKTVAQAEKLMSVAQKQGVQLMVGHIERFNPAVREIKRRLEANELGRVFRLHAQRLSAFPQRIVDVGVILDLAIHDLDVMQYLTGSKIIRRYAETGHHVHPTYEDMLCALLRFETGEMGVLDVSWCSPQRIRQLTVMGEGGTYVADYLTQDLWWYKNGAIDGEWDNAKHFSGAIEGDVLRTYIPKKEPLRAELEAFVDCVLNNKTSPVTGQEATDALKVGIDLVERGGRQSRPPLPFT